MPKKTRAQKILSQLRKRQKLLQQSTPRIEQQKIVIQKSPSQEKKTVPTISNTENQQLKQHFLSDLRRSFTFISIIIALEIVIYFASINN